MNVFPLVKIGAGVLLALAAGHAQSRAKNVILFLGDGAGVSSLNTASIYGYGRPQALYMQHMPGMALADTSTAREWVSDAAAASTAYATGVKSRNGVVSQTPDAERGVKDGANLKTILEYAEEQGLSTGIIANDDRTGVTIAAVAAFYSHTNNRQDSGGIFRQLLAPKFGDGVDVVIGTGRKWIGDQLNKSGFDMAAGIKASGYAHVETLDQFAKVDAGRKKVMALSDDTEFDMDRAVQLAIARLEKNPKGYFLVVFSDCHVPKTTTVVNRIIELDKAVRSATEAHRKDTLVLVTADHSFDLRLRGEALTETARDADPKKVMMAVALESQHTAEEVPLFADGPGAERVHGFVANTDVFHIMRAAFGWEKYQVEKRYPIGGDGGWDYISIDSHGRRIYASHDTQVEVVDADTGKHVGIIADTPGVHGIAFAVGLRRGFTSNGKENKVSLFDLDTLKVLRKIDVGKGPDGIYFHNSSNRVFTCNHGSHDITAIDASSGKVVGTVVLAGDGEQMVTGRDGLLYVNVEDTAEVVAFDPYTLAVRHRFPIGAGKTPTGLAYDPIRHRLFIGCRSQSMVVMDASDGRVIKSLPIGAGVDAAEFDRESQRIFISNGDGTLNIFRQTSDGGYEDAGSMKTEPGAKTMTFDPVTRKVFQPVAAFDMIPAAEAGGKPKRKIKPGTFSVLVVSPQ